jgi:hypothetical protein
MNHEIIIPAMAIATRLASSRPQRYNFRRAFVAPDVCATQPRHQPAQAAGLDSRAAT